MVANCFTCNNVNINVEPFLFAPFDGMLPFGLLVMMIDTLPFKRRNGSFKGDPIYHVERP
jgi:hypothetical protein